MWVESMSAVSKADASKIAGGNCTNSPRPIADISGRLITSTISDKPQYRKMARKRAFRESQLGGKLPLELPEKR